METTIYKFLVSLLNRAQMSQMKGFGLRISNQNSGSFENCIENTHNHWSYKNSCPHKLPELIGIAPASQAEEDEFDPRGYTKIYSIKDFEVRHKTNSLRCIFYI